MANNNPSSNPFNNLMRLSVRCPVCANLYDMHRLQILGEREQQVLTYIDCAACGAALLSILSLGQNGMTAQGLVTDLNLEEVLDFEESPAVNADDVLLAHERLEDHPAAFMRLK